MELILNQSILPYILILCYIEKRRMKAKNDMDANPLRGDGQWAWKILFKKIFLLPVVTISSKWYNSSWFLYRMKSRAYKVWKLKISIKKGDPWGDLKAQKSLSSRRSSFFLLCLLKNSNIIRLKYSQNHFESTFGSAYF